MHILTFTSLYPNNQQPNHGIFVRNRMEAFANKFGHQLTVIAPIAYYPKLPFKTFPKYDLLTRIPLFENDRGYPIWHPRYLVTPKIGMRWYSHWMKLAVKTKIKEIHKRQPIDFIDAHYLYPDGVAAVEIGVELKIPVNLSARGTDMNVFTKIKSIFPLIQGSLNNCHHLICVSNSLKEVALSLRVPESKITTIGNGVDISLFKILEKGQIRSELNLRQDRRLFISVGQLNENKGFHLILDAFAKIEDKGTHLVIVGDGPQRNELQSLVYSLGLKDRITLTGAVLNSDLPKWYSAADFLVLASAREGWPNVVCEAQAMGLPVIATNVSGIPEIISENWQGILVQNRDATSLHTAMTKALVTAWDNKRIEEKGKSRSWETVSIELSKRFSIHEIYKTSRYSD